MSPRFSTTSRNRAIAAALLGMLAASSVALVQESPRAEDKPVAKAGTLADAKAHMDQGQALFLDKKFAEAAAEFRAAYQIKAFSTFLFNEGVCHEKLRAWNDAIALFKKYIDVDPNAPDRQAVIARIAKLEAERDKELGTTTTDAGAPDTGPPPPPPAAVTVDEIRSIVLVESVPDGAPVEVWRGAPGAEKFVIGGANPGWSRVASGVTPFTQSLPLGNYHVVLPKWQDYRATETDVTVAAATISQFKANLAQGAFFGVMKVRTFAESGEVRGAHVFIKEQADKKFLDRGNTPYEESLESGTYTVRVELPGFKPSERKIDVVHGKIDEQGFTMERTDEGLIRVEVQGADEAEVYIDNHVIGVWKDGARIETPVTSGSHRVKVKADDRKTWVADVDVPRGKMIVVHSELKPSVGRGSAWATGIAAAVFIGGGIFLGVQSNDLRSELDSARADFRLDQDDPRIRRGKYFAIGADACFAIGGVLALISAYNFVKDPLPPSKGWSEKPRDLDTKPASPTASTFRLTPTFSPTFTGLALMGQF